MPGAVPAGIAALGRRCHSQPPASGCRAAAHLRGRIRKKIDTQVFVVCPCLEAARCVSTSEREEGGGEREEKEIPSGFNKETETRESIRR